MSEVWKWLQSMSRVSHLLHTAPHLYHILSFDLGGREEEALPAGVHAIAPLIHHNVVVRMHMGHACQGRLNISQCHVVAQARVGDIIHRWKDSHGLKISASACSWCVVLVRYMSRSENCGDRRRMSGVQVRIADL